MKYLSFPGGIAMGGIAMPEIFQALESFPILYWSVVALATIVIGLMAANQGRSWNDGAPDIETGHTLGAERSILRGFVTGSILYLIYQVIARINLSAWLLFSGQTRLDMSDPDGVTVAQWLGFSTQLITAIFAATLGVTLVANCARPFRVAFTAVVSFTFLSMAGLVLAILLDANALDLYGGMQRSFGTRFIFESIALAITVVAVPLIPGVSLVLSGRWLQRRLFHRS